MNSESLEDIEIDLLVEGILRVYGYDFTGYARSSLRRRISGIQESYDIATISALTDRILHDKTFFHAFLNEITVKTSEMFRDPYLFQTLQEHILPKLQTYPFLRIWHAGCANGEEVYSLAILLHEHGLLERCRIYATDLSDRAIKRAREGVFDLELVRQSVASYQKSGGADSLASYYEARHGHAIIQSWLRKPILFSMHNLVMDSVFGEMHLVLCRNVMIYFTPPLKEKVLHLLNDSVTPNGFLILGIKESLDFAPAVKRHYHEIAPRSSVYVKDGL